MKSALILTGGYATRAGGYPKYLFCCGERTFLEIQVAELERCTDEILVVCRDEEQTASFPDEAGIKKVYDIMPGRGPAGGIQAGSWYATGEYFFVTACDMPFICCRVISYLFEMAAGYDAAVPVWENGRYEPLCAVYKRKAVQEYYQYHSEHRISSLVRGIATRLIPVDDLRVFDHDLKFFTNINEVESLELIKKIRPD